MLIIPPIMSHRGPNIECPAVFFFLGGTAGHIGTLKCVRVMLVPGSCFLINNTNANTNLSPYHKNRTRN